MSRTRNPKKYDAGLTAALKRVGGPTKLAAKIGVVPSAITQWSRIPAAHVPAIAEITGIPRHELRPDMWEPPVQASAA